MNSGLKSVRNALFWSFCVVLVFGAGFILFNLNPRLYLDENFHFNQIVLFYNNNYILTPQLSMIPGFHLGIAAILKLLRSYPFLINVKILVFLINLAVIFIFYKTARKIDKPHAFIKTLQFCFLPPVFPFYFLIYTDIISLTLVLAALYFLLFSKPFLSAGFAFLSVLTRQNNIIYLLFNLFFYYIHYKKYGKLRRNKEFTIYILYFVFLCLFAGFVWFNRGIALGSKEWQQTAINSWGNVYLFLFWIFVLHIPEIFREIFGLIGILMRKKKILIILPVLFLIFNWSFNNNHPWNQATWFIHNRIAVIFASSLIARLALFIISSVSILWLYSGRLIKPYFNYIFIFIFFYLAVLPLIEFRYYFVPLALFMLFKRNSTLRVEAVKLVFYIFLSLYFSRGILAGNFFL